MYQFMYLHVCHDICLYLPVWTGISAWVYARGAPLTVCETARLSVVRVGSVQDTFPIHMINILFFSKHSPRQRRVVSGPDHGPRVDVEQGAARPRPPVAVADSPWKTGVLAMQQASRNRAVVPRREKGQTAKDVRERNDVCNIRIQLHEHYMHVIRM